MRCARDKRGMWLLAGLWCLVSACQGNDQPARRPDSGPRPTPPVSPPPVSPPPVSPRVDAGSAPALDAGADFVPDAGSCPRGLLCDGRCVDPQTDAAHCGRCGRACAAGAVCAGGACRPSNRPDAGVVCATGEARCGGYCATLATDPLHCGRCRNQCAESQVCVAGSCVSNVAAVRDAGPVHCVGGQVQCGGYCARLATDPLHCGQCDNHCASNQTCVAGRCTTSAAADGTPSTGCPAPRTQCGNYCTNLTGDPLHCGRCGNRCPTGQVCAAGRCAASENVALPDAVPAAPCVSPAVSCGAYCVNLTNDPLNCGRCATRCPAGRVCTAGHCAVPGTGQRAPAGTPRVPAGAAPRAPAAQ